MHMRLRIFLAGTLAAALLVAGCGGDDDTTSSSTTAATGTSGASGASGEQGATGTLPADFAAEANSICKAGDEDLNKAFGQLGQQPSDKQVDEIVSTQVVPLLQGQIDDLEALGDPEEGADEYNALLDDAQAALDKLEQDPAGLINSGTDPFEDVNAQAKQMGLDDCS